MRIGPQSGITRRSLFGGAAGVLAAKAATPEKSRVVIARDPAVRRYPPDLADRVGRDRFNVVNSCAASRPVR